MTIGDSVRTRAVCFTVNNYTQEDLEFLAGWCPRDASYLVYGLEIGEETKTPHVQGYVEFPNARRGSALKKLCGGKFSARVRLGTPEQAATYCKKGEQPKPEWEEFKASGPNFGLNAKVCEFGTISAQGKRADLDEVSEMVRSNVPLRDIVESHTSTFIKYHRGIERAIEILHPWPERKEPPKVIWRWGLAGIGKTRGAYEAHKSVYLKDNTIWWNNYTQQEAIIIDDFNPNKWDFRDILRILDRYPYQGQVKGGYVHINSPIIYITCEFPPTYYWSGNDLAQISRRVSEVTEIKEPGT